MIAPADLFEPQGDFAPEDIASVGLELAKVEAWIAGYIEDAYTRPGVASCADPDAAAAVWASYRLCRRLDVEASKSSSSVNIAGELSTARLKEQVLVWRARAAEYLASFEVLASTPAEGSLTPQPAPATSAAAPFVPVW